MQLAFQYAFLIPLLPAAGFALLAFLGPRLRAPGWVALAFEAGALGAALWVTAAELTAALPYHDRDFTWLSFANGTNFVMGTLVSPLGALMLVVVNVVGLLVVLYSNEYMAHEDGLPRYYAELMLFLAAMNGLVLSDNYLEFILMWELVGLCSYLLVGFFWRKPSAAAAAKKAFLVTRVGDVLFFVGVFIFFTSLGGALDPQVAAGSAPLTWANAGFTFTPPNVDSSQTFLNAASIQAALSSGSLSLPLMTVAGLMILGGAAGKSAQFPLHTWLPDAMEGPTTVSALIHAATMVAAGIYLLAITSAYVGFTPTAALVILGIGGFTSLFAGTMGLVSQDIKRVVAYSTISQLGYMTMGVGAASLVAANGQWLGVTLAPAGTAMFHLFTHAFFKALLFLCAGAVIHAVGTQDISKMGGLRKLLPVTSAAMLVGALALSGIVPFSGFFSKDDILGLTLQAAQLYPEAWIFLGMALAGVFLTALYIFRLWFLVFSGEKSRSPLGGHADAHGAPDAHAPAVHEPSWVMRAPLVVLAGLTAVAGFLPLIPAVSHRLLPGVTWSVFGYTVVGTSTGFHLADAALAALSLGLALAGIGTAYALWGNGRVFTLPAGSPLLPLHKVVSERYYFDAAYDAFGVSVVLGLARVMDWADRYIIDGTVHGFEDLFSLASRQLRQLQTGVVSSYARWIVVGLLVLLIFGFYVAPYLGSIWGATAAPWLLRGGG